MKNIRLFAPDLGNDELDEIRNSFEKQWIGLGPKVKQFEDEFKKYLRVNEGSTIATNSATAALHLAVLSLDLPKGTKVVVPNITFISTALVVKQCGLEPVFVDVENENLQIDLKLLKEVLHIHKNIGAIITVHFGGHYCDLYELMNICKLNGIPLIEDCANCTGGEFKGKKLGTFGDIGCYSFEEKKNMTTGDGGMIYFRDPKKRKWFEQMRWCGINKDTWKRIKGQSTNDIDPYHWYYEVSLPGFKYNMNDLAACIGLVQLRKLDHMNAYRSELIQTYLNELSKVMDVKPSWNYELNEISGYWLFSLRAKKRDQLIQFLKKHGIATGSHFTPMTLHPIFQTSIKTKMPISETIHNELITLPLHCGMNKEDVLYVTDNIQKFYQL